MGCSLQKFGDQVLTIAEAEQAGVAMEMVRVCREIRKLAKLDRIKLDQLEHRSKRNLHLFSYIEYCGKDVLTYVKEYLSNLQPYMLQRLKGQELSSSFICILDRMYRVSIYIKLNKTFGGEVIVSFHESNKRGIAKDNRMLLESRNFLVPVIADEICARVDGTAREEIKIFMQRGMLTLPVRVMGQKCENGVYAVVAQELEMPVVDECNKYLADLYSSNLQLDALDRVELFSVLHQISFTSFGHDVFSNISLLIDNLAMQKSAIGRQAADFALTTYVEHLILDDGQAAELIGLIDERYKVRSQQNFDLILERIKGGLQADAVGIDELSSNVFGG